MGAFHINLFNISIIIDFLLNQIIRNILFAINDSTAIKRITKHSVDVTRLPSGKPCCSLSALLLHDVLNFTNTIASQVKFKDSLHCFSLFFIYNKLIPYSVIAKDITVAIQDSILK